eukprot:TRINITY_DN11687_c0_g1_i1.p1 TRINITY_DN11687_c0_g1~~TRINITY_DN11687_c0_g1_i1.p1  ORF type:complete len:129 (+),score=33.64 TRINITY_DN11687_c0_g1_i1:114-500(+)
MSWDYFINETMMKRGDIAKGAIIGLDGTIWGKSANLKLSESEAKSIAEAFSAPNPPQIPSDATLSLESDSYFTKKAADGGYEGKGPSYAVLMEKTHRAVLVAFFTYLQSGYHNNLLSKLADYVKSCGV